MWILEKPADFISVVPVLQPTETTLYPFSGIIKGKKEKKINLTEGERTHSWLQGKTGNKRHSALPSAYIFITPQQEEWTLA